MIIPDAPPSCFESEQAVIGCLLIEKNLYYDGGIQEEYFESREYRLAMRAVANLALAGKGVDCITVHDEMRKFEPDTNIDLLYEACASVHNTYNYNDYKNSVFEHYVRRQVFRHTKKMETMCIDGMSVEEIMGHATTINSLHTETYKSGKLIGDTLEVLEAILSEKESQVIGQYSLDCLNKNTGGIRAGELILIGARPGVGKSLLALNICASLVKQGVKCTFFSAEMTKAQIVTRFVCSIMQKQSNELKGMSEEDFTSLASKLDKFKNECNIYDSFGEFSTLVQLIRKEALLGTKVIFVDYIQMVKNDLMKGQNMNYQIGDMANKLKSLALEFGIAIICPAQINRAYANGMRKPRVADLKDSGDLEQACDVAILMHHESTHDEYNRHSNVVDIIVDKNRNGMKFEQQCTYRPQHFLILNPPNA